MDGRIQKPLREFAREKFGVDFVDAITDRGGLLRHLPGAENEGYVENMLQNIQVSLTAHNSKGIIMAGHQECAGYPIPGDQKRKEVVDAANLLRGKFAGIEIIPVFVVENEGGWKVENL